MLKLRLLFQRAFYFPFIRWVFVSKFWKILLHKNPVEGSQVLMIVLIYSIIILGCSEVIVELNYNELWCIAHNVRCFEAQHRTFKIFHYWNFWTIQVILITIGTKNSNLIHFKYKFNKIVDLWHYDWNLRILSFQFTNQQNYIFFTNNSKYGSIKHVLHQNSFIFVFHLKHLQSGLQLKLDFYPTKSESKTSLVYPNLKRRIETPQRESNLIRSSCHMLAILKVKRSSFFTF